MLHVLIRVLLLLILCHRSSCECHCRNGCCSFKGTDACSAGWYGPFCQKQNIALGKHTYQSSTYNFHDSQLAVNGQESTTFVERPATCSITGVGDTNPSWTVYLGNSTTFTIKYLKIYLRSDLPERNKGMEIYVGSHLCYTFQTVPTVNPTGNEIECPTVLSGNTVSVCFPNGGAGHFVTLCKVLVFNCADGWFGKDCGKQCHCSNKTEVCDKFTGHCSSGCRDGYNGTGCQTLSQCHCAGVCTNKVSTNCNSCIPGWYGPSCQKENVAWGKPTCQTSTYQDPNSRNCFPSNLAVDGNTATNFNTPPVTCSCTGSTNSNSTWTVQLGKNSHFKIKHMKIFMRGDVTYMYRYQGVQIKINNQFCKLFNAVPNVNSNGNDIECSQSLLGNTVSIASPLHGYLALCEVQVFQCGDYWFGKECSEHCNCKDKNEVCDKFTGHCSSGCRAGYSESDCQTPCLPGFYGNGCNSMCGHCQSQAECNHIDGTCTSGCKAGWQGSRCRQECNNGYFGLRCNTACKCFNAGEICNKIEGTCQSGCRAGYTGSNCQKACLPGFYGNGCNSMCGHCQSQAECNHIDGTCTSGCKAGWQGSRCRQECNNGYFGLRCNTACKCFNAGEICNKIEGTCQSGCRAGYTGSNCQKACKAGAYGRNCNSTCGHCLFNSQCDKRNGTCKTGCESGWNGTKCTQECPDGWYGKNCLERCGHCGHSTCDKHNGTCLGLCEPGWMTATCKQPCDDNKYGQNCSLACGYCNGSRVCNKTSGVCTGGCDSNFEPNLCQKCTDGWYGDKCDKQCGHCVDSFCNKNNGACPGLCQPGWINVTCDQPCRDGRYGQNCSKICRQCKNGTPCNKTNGVCGNGCNSHFFPNMCTTCTDGWYGGVCDKQCGHCAEPLCNNANGACHGVCQPGWINVTCDQPCEDGKYGQNCSSTCGYCANDEMCNKTDGVCMNGCQTNFAEPKCDECVKGWYGDMCNETCGSCKSGSCDRNSGECGGGCTDNYIGKYCREQSKLEGSPSSKIGPIAGAVCGVVVTAVVAIVTAFLIKRRRARSGHAKTSTRNDATQRVQTIHNTAFNDARIRTEEQEQDSYYEELSHVEEERIYSELADGNSNSRSTYYNTAQTNISLDKLLDTLKDKTTHGVIEAEFKKIPSGSRHPHKEAEKSENKKRNRFQSLYPYDATRVILKGGNTDYINASYIPGYSEGTKYIATQALNAMTVDDFWRMVWQEKCEEIVMLTNIEELEKKLCERYWPKSSKKKTYGGLAVTTVNTIEGRDFTVSILMLEKSELERRKVVHYHFTAWPEDDVPSTIAIVDFWRRVKEDTDDRTPMVVQCSSGVGRTGTFIALDYLMDEVQQTNDVNVSLCVSRMREARMDMVQTLCQYRFIYDALLEAVKSQDTHYTVEEFGNTFGERAFFTPEQTLNLKTQYLLCPELTEEETSTARLPENKAKNKSTDILPSDRSIPYLSTPLRGRNDYINAVYLSTFHRHNSLIVTQTPILDTVVDFWRLVYDHDCFIIVCLDYSVDVGKMYPSDSTTTLRGPFSIICRQMSGHNITERCLTIKHIKQRKEKEVTVLCPANVNQMLRKCSYFMELVTRVEREAGSEDGKILVHCSNGADISGLFCAVLNIVSRLRHNSDVNVFQAVRELQSVRPQFVNIFEDYTLCYDMVKEYIRTSGAYANC